MPQHYDVIVIGSGVGGGAVSRRVAERGARVLLLERGDFLPREADNWSVEAVFFAQKYSAGESWLDRRGAPFDAGAYYHVGGPTKFYGAAMFRFRERDFQAVQHAEGLSPAWPIGYADLEPYYDQAEALFGVHGDDRDDPTAPRGRKPYPFPAVASEPVVARMAQRLRSQGLHPSALPLAIDVRPGGKCILCRTCDGFPCKLAAKNDAQTCLVEPALATGRVDLWTNAAARRLRLSPDGRSVQGVEVEHAGELKTVSARIVVVSCNAVNSAALLLRSACAAAPQGAANSSGVVGRHYMTHNQSALMALSPRANTTVFQKTLAMNDFYFGDRAFPFPMGQAQMLGKLQGGMLSANIPYLPRFVGSQLARRSVDWLVLSEDLPDPENRVSLDGSNIRLATPAEQHGRPSSAGSQDGGGPETVRLPGRAGQAADRACNRSSMRHRSLRLGSPNRRPGSILQIVRPPEPVRRRRVVPAALCRSQPGPDHRGPGGARRGPHPREGFWDGSISMMVPPGCRPN